MTPVRKKPPALTPAEVFAQELPEARRRARLTQQQLADRLEALGSPIDRSAIGKIEAGQRGVSLNELFTFASALGVSPLSLVVPQSAAEVKIAPKLDVDTIEALQWARNFRPLSNELMISAGLDQLGLDGAGIRAFYDAVTDREAEAYRRYAPLRPIVDAVSNLILAATNSDDRFRARALRNLLKRLALDVQRAWEDSGETGDAAQVAKAEAAATEAWVDEFAKQLYKKVGLRK